MEHLVSRVYKICNVHGVSSSQARIYVRQDLEKGVAARESNWKKPRAGQGVPESDCVGRGFAVSPHLYGVEPRYRGARRTGPGNRLR